ncbi:hypothetical protein B2G71_22150 [Novosphingobium sp. PC22D]|uniref:histidine kinase n=1 Tax=Novosphingobium sp. PC22D TaxID=1962403 RepID=UPI000BF2322B|nr:histidine kinase [Novosphingobium sp. PC22D]PEQ10462.1 hypothetical protein B2G71_22150 [Novosphingobium sp. PC22D]
MHFDDRLATVLRLPVKSEALAWVQFRQLLDILGRADGEISDAVADAAYARLDELAKHLPAARRARVLEEPGTTIRNPDLLARLALEPPDVATAAVRAGRLSEAQWLDLIPALPVRARGILRHRRDLPGRVLALLDRLGIADRGLPPAQPLTATPAATGSTASEAVDPPRLAVVDEQSQATANRAVCECGAAAENESDAHAARARHENVVAFEPKLTPQADREAREAGIGDIVRRIEAFRATRASTPSPTPPHDDPRLPLDDGQVASMPLVEVFDFTADAQGRLSWAEPTAAPMVVGLRLDQFDSPAPPARGGIVASLRHRQPIRNAPARIVGAAPVAGDWLLDAAPQFDGQTGHFAGYLGRLRRASEPHGQSARADRPAHSEPDLMRQVLHELRTPANAIQMSAEVIQQSLFGPVPHDYRALAANVAGDIAQILAGFDELERAVKLEGGATSLTGGSCDLADVVTGCVARLDEWNRPRGSGFDLDELDIPLFAALGAEDGERLIWRVIAALAGRSAPGERLAIRGWSASGQAVLEMELPGALADLDPDLGFGERLDTSEPYSLLSGRFGLRFTLRLARAEARGAGGTLERNGNALRLSLPGLTVAAVDNSADEPASTDIGR